MDPTTRGIKQLQGDPSVEAELFANNFVVENLGSTSTSTSSSTSSSPAKSTVSSKTTSPAKSPEITSSASTAAAGGGGGNLINRLNAVVGNIVGKANCYKSRKRSINHNRTSKTNKTNRKRNNHIRNG